MGTELREKRFNYNNLYERSVECIREKNEYIEKEKIV